MDWIENMDPMHMKEIIDVNLLGTAYAVSAFARQQMDLPVRKKIIIIGSMAHKSVLNASAVYCASKAGVAHLVRCLGWELTPKGFDIFGIHPSNTEGTPMTKETINHIARYRNLDAVAAEDYWSSINLKDRWLHPSDIAHLVRHLCFGKSAEWMSGTNIDLAGGQR
jgi:NAD(P)-dependent dehydrogenase (short-subunit alcohol dehydrogenase family)